MMRLSAFAMLIVAFTTPAWAEEWYESLPMGIQRMEVHSIAGTPSSSQGDKERYDLVEGYIELAYKNDELIGCRSYSDTGKQRRTYYYHSGGSLDPAKLQTRMDYLKAKEFAHLPKFNLAGPFIRTDRYDSGEGYQIGDSYLVITPMTLMGGYGYFTDKTAKVVFVDGDRNETILYRAIDNWANLKPPQLDAKQVEERTKKLRELGEEVIGRSIREIFGEVDSTMGSGDIRALFYLEDALAIARFGPNKTISSISISRPGGSPISLEKWRN